MNEPYRAIYSILLRRGGKIVEFYQLGSKYYITIESPVETENLSTGETWTDRFVWEARNGL